MSNGFSSADMSTAAANGHADGYQAGYVDAVKAVEVGKPAAAQEAVAPHGWLIAVDNKPPLFAPATHPDIAEALRGIEGATVTEVFTAPVAAAPSGSLSPLARIADAFGVTGTWDQIADAAIARSTPAAPGIDLAERLLCVLIEEGVLARNGRVFQKLRALIDASPKGGSDALDAARYRWLRTRGARQSEIAMHYNGPALDRMIDAEIVKGYVATSAEVGG